MFVTSLFITCQLYHSFVSARGQSALDAAFLISNEQRAVLLEPLRGMQGVPQQLAESIEAVLQLFDEKLPLSDRANFMWSNLQHAVKLAVRWDPAGPIGTFGKLFEGNCPSHREIKFPVFHAAVKAIVDVDLFLS